MHEKSKMELGCNIFIVEKESKVYAIHKKSKMELRYSILTVESVRSVQCIKQAEYSSELQK